MPEALHSVTEPAFQAGFANPVIDSQRSFRAIMDAMARPGTIQQIGLDLAPPAPVSVAAAATVLALCDYETTLWIAPSLAEGGALGAYFTFHTGTSLTPSAGEAQFALIDLSFDGLDLLAFAQGTPEYPDRSTTIIAQVPSLFGGEALQASGPGIETTASFAPAGLPADFLRQWADNRDRFPLGIDMIFCDGAALLGLPRSTRLTKGAL
ncbi:MAG: phosphonate C-P lyase system protein PhnH [Phyllobacteriaceae bacterium]|nr:phosphonate C-P lyase system protein PhnH [Phyllobacteriaceae bacterium]